MTDIHDTTVIIEGKRISVNDRIKVLPTPGNKSSFIGVIKGWWLDEETGTITAIDVWGGRPQKEKMRSVRPDQVAILSTRMQNKFKRQDEARRNGE